MKTFPTSLYRIQFSSEFPLKRAIQFIPYLKKLGIEGIYCSPYFKAFSSHGYDIIDPNQINPHIGTKADFERFCRELKKHNLFHIIDIVPNHMGIQGGNRWWDDVLMHGKKSKYAHYFDINWELEKILVPLLGESLEEAVEKGLITIISSKGKSFAKYGNLLFPLRKTVQKPKSKSQLLQTINDQHYLLTSWLTAGHRTSYRRFFNIGDLIGVRIEEKEVFDAHHKFIFELLQKNMIDGVRVDHPDGLYDPVTYFRRLRKKCKGLIIVEKILEYGEELPKNWDVDGTVGYEYLNWLTGIFIQKSPALTSVYRKFSKMQRSVEDLLFEKKKYYLTTEMAGDVLRLAKQIHPFSSIGEEELLAALQELLVAFPVYRSYITPDGKMSPIDQKIWKKTFDTAYKRSLKGLHPALTFIKKIVFGRIQHPILLDFLMRFQQLCAPIMAKGFEDITLYSYNRLLALNEVGSSPGRGGTSPSEFHAFCQRKLKDYPKGLLALSTHDTKRSCDVRMQLSILSEIPHRWEKKLWEWSACNKKHKTSIHGNLYPEPNMEYFLYQIILGVWPDKPSTDRIWQSFLKSIREARVNTSWRYPNEPYERSCEQFIRAILRKNSPFLQSFRPFQKEIQQLGEWKSLASIALQAASPGIVDIYQGCEDFCYTLVDPDNRQLISYPVKESLKTELYTQALAFRRRHKKLFLEGEYIPLKITGSKRDHLIAFMRKLGKKTLIVVAARFVTDLEGLENTKISLPSFFKGTSLFTKQTFTGKILQANEVLKEFPFTWIFSSQQL